MSLIRKTFEVDGVLVDPTEVVLASSDLAYGVKRNDTDEVVVEAETALTKLSTGRYQLSFTDPAYGLSYTYVLRVTYSGETYHIERVLAGPAEASDEDLLCQRSDIEQIYGLSNVVKWADLDNSEDASDIASRITLSILRAQEEINNRFRGSLYSVPFATGTSANTQMKYLCAELAGVLLYESRGVQDFHAQTGRMFHRLEANRNRVELMIKDLLAGKRRLDLDTAIRYPAFTAIEDADE
jgi:hypothetical protein